MITETLKLDHAEYVELCNMFKSSDKKNSVTAIEVIKNLEVKDNIAYMILLYINYGKRSDKDLSIIKDKIFEYLHSIDAEVFHHIYDGYLCMETVYYIAKRYNTHALDSIKQIIVEWLKENFHSFGWEFMDDLKLQLGHGNA